MRVALFATCVNDAVHPSTAIATVRLLERLGVEVDFPAAQTCCGQPQFNTGTEARIRALSRCASTRRSRPHVPCTRPG
ncbi:(Fe-S)-binding protein [Streptomyces sp. A475]|uniref:(Fe-S)-binding protein n=1 Tax=Streptomyces sp. A475 TaxID=3131976 RepID=UPI0030C9165B